MDDSRVLRFCAVWPKTDRRLFSRWWAQNSKRKGDNIARFDKPFNNSGEATHEMSKVFKQIGILIMWMLSLLTVTKGPNFVVTIRSRRTFIAVLSLLACTLALAPVTVL